MYKKNYLPILTLFFCAGLAQELCAQFTVGGQIRTRTEMRNGQGAPQKADTVPAVFTSQRTRLAFGYSGYRFKLYGAVQDVRVWGQDASSINRNTTDAYDGLMLHEAWGEISLLDTGKNIENFTLKIGRQELVYDDVRLLGNLDWLQQARRHDAMLLKFSNKGWTAHLGAAFNQNAERKSNHIYNGVPTGYPAGTNGIGTMYKSMQFLYLGKKFHFGNGSFLFFKDDFSKLVDPVNNIYGQGVNSRLTTGFYLTGTAERKLTFTTSAYYQGGKYRDGADLSEYLLSVYTQYSIGRKFSVGPGIDLTSGNDGSDPAKKSQRFDPLYGTPHKFWGYMDYFYVADGFGTSGLMDLYLRARLKAKDNFTMTLDVHKFNLANELTSEGGDKLDKALGTEFDFVLNYNLTKIINIEAGYSMMFSTDTMLSPEVKNVPDGSKTSSWAYLMISIKPEFSLKVQ